MASVQKYKQEAIFAMLRHNERSARSHNNPDIQANKKHLNYRLSPERNCTDYDFFKSHLSDYKYMQRSDVVKMATWIITAPADLPPAQEKDFFNHCRIFLNQRYGAANELQCIVHYDEIHSFIDSKTGQIKTSRPHMHYSFIPAIIDKKGDLRICAKKLLTREDLRNFHPDLQRYLKHNGINGTIYSGITKNQGNNISVQEIKKSTPTISRDMSERRFQF